LHENLKREKVLNYNINTAGSLRRPCLDLKLFFSKFYFWF
jgi:hypothetical protein